MSAGDNNGADWDVPGPSARSFFFFFLSLYVLAVIIRDNPNS
jgi:hypothetical protein